jgi:hypothetical protein
VRAAPERSGPEGTPCEGLVANEGGGSRGCSKTSFRGGSTVKGRLKLKNQPHRGGWYSSAARPITWRGARTGRGVGGVGMGLRGAGGLLGFDSALDLLRAFGRPSLGLIFLKRSDGADAAGDKLSGGNQQGG